MSETKAQSLPAARYVLFGTELSYYSAKARAYLRWKGVDFEERPSDARFYKDVCEPRLGRRMIPVVVTPDDITIQDTTLILDYFEAEHDGPGLTVPGGVRGFVDSLIELYADDWLVMPSMLYRWTYDAEVTTLDIGMAFAPAAAKEEQLKLGRSVSRKFRGVLPLLGITEATRQSFESSWEAVLADLDAHFRTYPFLFGHRPARADFALLGALYAHQYRDASSYALMRSKALAVAHYVERMMYPNPYYLGEYLPGDKVPETLLPLLRRMMSEQIPYLSEVVRQLDDWKAAHPEDATVPKELGMASAIIEGWTIERMIQPYSTWLLRRAKARCQNLEAAERQAADQLLLAVNGQEFQQIEIRYPLDYDDRALTWAG